MMEIPERWWITPMEGAIPESVYQAFKARLMKDLARDGLVVGDKKWRLVVEPADRAGGKSDPPTDSKGG